MFTLLLYFTGKLSDEEYMIIESMELENFKSFGGKVRIDFRPGFTVITGPNGSGKSNIGDAMLFVLGIRSSKAIRVDRLPELVNKSSEDSRVRSCSVTLNLSYEDEEKNTRKISITREIEIDGETAQSNFYINGSRVRRMDVENFLDSNSIYLDAYSFVLQGDINNLTKMTGVERRKLLESIAGIEAYDVKLKEAESYITKVNEDLNTLEVMKSDTGIRVESLHQEKIAAEKFLELERNIKDYEATLLQREIISLQREIDAYRKQEEEAKKNIEAQEAEVEKLISEIQRLKQEVSETQKEKESKADPELREVESKINAANIERARIEIRLDGLKTENGTLEERISTLNDSMDEKRKKLSDYESLHSSKISEKKKISSEVDSINNELQVLGIENESNSKRIESLRGKIKEKEEQVAEMEKSLLSIEKDLTEINGRKTELTYELSSVSEKEENYRLSKNDAKFRLDEIEREEASRKSDLEKLNKRYYELKSRLDEINREKDALNTELREQTRNYEKINAMVSQGKESSARALTVINGEVVKGRLTGVKGTVRDLLTFSDEYRTAIQAAAGSRLNSIVVDNDETAEKCLEILKRDKAGRLTFLPLNKMAQGRPRGKAIMVRGNPDCIGYFSELVKVPQGMESIIWYIFQDTLLMKDVRSARMNMGGVRLVTMEGDIFETSGAITGGYTEKKAQGASLQEKAGALSAKIGSLNIQLESLNKEFAEKNDEFYTVSEELKNASRSAGEKGSDIAKLKASYEEAEKNLQEITPVLREKERLLQEIIKRSEELATEKESNSNRLDQLRGEVKDIYRELSDLSPEIYGRISSLNSRKEGLRQQLDSLNTEISDISGEIKVLKSEIESMKKDCFDMEKRMGENKESLEDLGRQMVQKDSDIEKLRILEEDLNSHLKEYNDRITSLNGQIEALNGDIETKKFGISSLRETLILLGTKISTSSAKMSEAENSLLTGHGSPIDTSMTNHEIKLKISECQEEIQSLGPINHRSIEEYQQEKEKLDILLEKIGKLLDEKKRTEEFMEQQNDEKRKGLVSLYENINRNMGEIYSRLSEGGQAELVMTGSSDPLDSEIYIKARPRGKTLRKIDSLSGGEKSLTAIAFILAVQKIKPSPIYYLDEIDMFLDGANAERIGKLFSENSRYSQIMMVSLKKSMLKYANILIGVTTTEKKTTAVFTKDLEGDE